MQNQADMEKPHAAEDDAILHQTHEHLKRMEMELTKGIGSVIIK